MNRAEDTLELLHGKRKVFGKNYTNSPNIQEAIRKRAEFARKRIKPANNAALSACRPRASYRCEKTELLGLFALQENLAGHKVVDHDECGGANLSDIGLESQAGVEGQHNTIVERQADHG